MFKEWLSQAKVISVVSNVRLVSQAVDDLIYLKYGLVLHTGAARLQLFMDRKQLHVFYVRR